MVVAAVADVDPVAIVVAALKASAAVAAHFGGPAGVSSLNEGPFPHLRVVGSPVAGRGRLLWIVDGEVLVEAYGAPGGAPGRAALRRKLMQALVDLASLPEQPQTAGPVVVDVAVPSSPAWVPDVATGQDRWVATVGVTAHPRP